MKVFKDHSEEALPKKMAWIAGEGMKEETGFWVQVFNGERPPKPVVTLHQKKISVRQEMSGPVQLNISHNDSPIDDRFGFRPFWLGKAGAYKLAYTVFVGDKSTLKTEYDIDVRRMYYFLLFVFVTMQETDLVEWTIPLNEFFTVILCDPNFAIS